MDTPRYNPAKLALKNSVCNIWSHQRSGYEFLFLVSTLYEKNFIWQIFIMKSAQHSTDVHGSMPRNTFVLKHCFI
jgi:hypothetical protein